MVVVSRIVQHSKAWLAFLIFALNFFLIYTYFKQVRSPDDVVDETRRDIRFADDRQLTDPRVSPDSKSSVNVEAKFNVPPLILYNRVPKTGSTTFANIAYKLTSKNGFSMLHLNVTYKNSHYMNIVDQQRFVSNISGWTEMQPALYHGHIRYLDFTRFGYRNPIYINIVRDPMERLISYYYFLRYGDDYRPHLKRASAQDSTTLDQCIVYKGKDCDLSKVMWLQIPFFCGQPAQCQVPDRWALEQAKTNLINHYLLVGVTEKLDEFIILLETILPRYFRGAYNLYVNGMGHLRKTKGKKQPSEETIALIKATEIYQLEQEFYEFAKEQFEFLKARALMYDKDGRIIVRKAGFKYEKIFPHG